MRRSPLPVRASTVIELPSLSTPSTFAPSISLIDAHLPRPYSLNPRRIDLMAQLTVLRSRIAGEPPQAVDVRVPT